MKIEEIEKEWSEIGNVAAYYYDADDFPSRYVQKLIDVAKAAKVQRDCGEPYYAHAEIEKALEELEKD